MGEISIYHIIPITDQEIDQGVPYMSVTTVDGQQFKAKGFTLFGGGGGGGSSHG